MNDNYPPAVSTLPKVGDQTIDMEKVVHLKPDLIVLDSAFNANQQSFDNLGLKVLELSCHRLADIPVALENLGLALGCQEEAEAQKEAFQKELAAISPLNTSEVFFVEIWGEPMMTVGSDTLVNDVLQVVGVKNCYADQSDYFQVDPEDVVNRRPDVILLPTKDSDAPSRAEELCRKVGLEPKVIRIDPDLLVRPSPRLISGMKFLRDELATQIESR